MKYQKKCDCCGHVVTAYTHHLNKNLLSALRQLVDFYEEHRKPANLQKDLSLTKNQYNNFQKLQYFNLVKKISGSSSWFPTVVGINFIYGRDSVFNPVATFGDRVLPNDHEAWKTHTGAVKITNIRDIDVDSYKQKEEYRDEKRNDRNLFNKL